MKTKNNVQKTILRSVAVILSFVMLSFTVTAQGYWKQLLTNNSFNQIAIALVENPTNVLNEKNSNITVAMTDIVDSYDEASEVSLMLEPWMTNLGYFGMGSSTFNEAYEPNLDVESWMTETNFFEASVSDEASLEVETWMTDSNFWNI